MPRALVLQARRELQLVEQRAAPLLTGEVRLRSRLSGISQGCRAEPLMKVALAYGGAR